MTDRYDKPRHGRIAYQASLWWKKSQVSEAHVHSDHAETSTFEVHASPSSSSRRRQVSPTNASLSPSSRRPQVSYEGSTMCIASRGGKNLRHEIQHNVSPRGATRIFVVKSNIRYHLEGR